MAHYVVNTPEDQAAMLKEVNLTWEEIIAAIPENVRFQGNIDIPEGKSELEVLDIMNGFASSNTIYKTVLRGAGAYRHFIPSVVGSLAGRAEFLTTYTPYQSEFSQGVLQSIFEFQTMISDLCGMDAANASVYDGASAVAEAINMTVDRKKTKAFLASSLHPQTIETSLTYTSFLPTEIEMIPHKGGRIDLDWLKENIDETAACVVIQQPNFYGILEDVNAIGTYLNSISLPLIVSANPMTLGLLSKPSQYGADIVVGEAQPLGLNLSFGGPYLGYMSATNKWLRRLPGRIVGQSVDTEGKRAFALTLQAREQHIRREKSSSSICSNQAHCALTAAIYLSAMGPEGLREIATQSYSKAHYFQEELDKLGFKLKYNQPFFHEFVTTSKVDTKVIEDELSEAGILSGYPLNHEEMLWCVTEVVADETLDKVISLMREISL